MNTPKIISEPTLEPVSIEEVKAQLRISTDDEEDLIRRYIRSARKYFEWRTGRALYTQTLEMAFKRFPASKLMLPRATPLQSITHVKYYDSDGNATTWSSSLYTYTTYDEPGYITPEYGQAFPTFTARVVDPIVVRYVAGTAYSTIEEFPDDYKIPILLLVGAQFENREAYQMISYAPKLTPYGVESYITKAMVRDAN